MKNYERLKKRNEKLIPMENGEYSNLKNRLTIFFKHMVI